MADNETAIEDFSVSEQEAFGLSRAAVLLDQAKQSPDDKTSMTNALNHNLELWVAIRAMVARPDSPLPDDAKNNLVKLSNFVADTTFKAAEGISDETIDTLININLQISEGLLEGLSKA